MNLWDKIIPQAIITLNLLRCSRLNPKLSTYAQVYGAFDFDNKTLAPPGTKVMVHEKPDNRNIWDSHTFEAW